MDCHPRLRLLHQRIGKPHQFKPRQPRRHIHFNVDNPSVYPESRRTISLCKQRSSVPRFKYKKIITQERVCCLMILCNKKRFQSLGGANGISKVRKIFFFALAAKFIWRKCTIYYSRFSFISLTKASFVSSLIEYIVIRNGKSLFAIFFISEADIGVFNVWKSVKPILYS